MSFDPALIKPAPDLGQPPGLFHVIVEIISQDREVYILAPMTNRVMPLSVLPESSVYAMIADLAAAIARLPANTIVYAARPDAFKAEGRHIRPLTAAEIAQLRQLLEVN